MTIDPDRLDGAKLHAQHSVAEGVVSVHKTGQSYVLVVSGDTLLRLRLGAQPPMEMFRRVPTTRVASP